jgi:hypothetical protein
MLTVDYSRWGQDLDILRVLGSGQSRYQGNRAMWGVDSGLIARVIGMG